MRDYYEKIEKAFQAATGLECADDMFKKWTNSDTMIHSAFPASPGRFVTISYEPFGLKKHGNTAFIHVKVWENFQLRQVAYLEPPDFANALKGNFDRRSFNGEYVVKARWCGERCNFTEFYAVFDDEEEWPEQWSADLEIAEIKFLTERLAPVISYGGFNE